MKKVLLLLAALLFTLPLLAGEPYFCTRPGTKLYYERYRAKDHKLTQTTLFEIDAYNGSQVHYAITLKKANGSDIYGGRTLQTAYIAPNGDVAIDFGQTVKGFLRNMFSGMKITTTESRALLPENMQPGDTLPETHCAVKIAGFSAKFDITERSVLRREQITTSAGTFDCMVVRERKQENAPLHHHDNWLDNYYVPGLGYVRHDKYDKNMRLLESEVLISIEEPAAAPAASDGQL